MKKFTKTKLFLTSLSLITAFTFHAQDLTLKTALITKGQDGKTVTSGKMRLNTEGTTVIQSNPALRPTLTNCTDKVDYVGSTPGPYYIGVGGQTVIPHTYEIGVFQVYPNYTGMVTGIEFVASKYSTPHNPDILVGIFDLVGGAPDVNSQNPSPVPFLTLSSTSSSLCSITFPSPVSVTNGFAIGIYVLGQDSARIIAGPLVSNVAPYYSYVYNSQANMSSFSSYFNLNSNVLAKPFITTSVNPSWLTAKTSTGCGIPAVYNFTNNTSQPPSYAGNVVINPSGITKTLDYGDGSPIVNNFPISSTPLTHSYTALGTYTAKYTQTYVGWINNCIESETVQITVDNPLPSFTYSVNGMTVTFNNTSQNLNSYSWNFGDLSTSTQTDPSHTFSSPGTYVVELTGTAPCGTVRFSLSVVVSATGIKEYTNSSSLITLFPNPAANTLQINNKSQSELDSKIEIFNSVGACVKVLNTANSTSTGIDISGLSKGIYFMKLKNKDGDIVKSFIKE